MGMGRSGELQRAHHRRWRRKSQYPEGQGPGPPHRPHPGAAAEELGLLDDPAAKTLIARAVLVDPQLGHFAFVSELIERSNCSNLASQALQVYS
jgi:hypothetical protein